MNLNELSNIELVAKIAEEGDELAKELLSRIDFCICEHYSDGVVLNRGYHFCNEPMKAIAAIRENCRNDGEAIGYLPFGTFRAARQVGEFFWDN